jgi:hypothetical protein
MLAQLMTVLGFVTAVLPPVLQAAGTVALPPLAQKILAVAGVVVFLAGVLKNAIANWQAQEHAQQQTLLKMQQNPGVK